MKLENIRAPKVDEIVNMYNPPPASDVKPGNGPVIAIATCSFGPIWNFCYDSHRQLIANLVGEYGKDNVWIIPTQGRMPFPDSTIYAIASMMKTEELTGRKVDWMFWLDDDVSVSVNIVSQLMETADAEKAPFVSAVGYDRCPPFRPAVWDLKDGKYSQWDRVHSDAVFRVGGVGMTACLFHRSLFDKIPEPWFAAGSSVLDMDTGSLDVHKGIKPDLWWSNLLCKHNIPIVVDTRPLVTHFSIPMPINHLTAQSLAGMAFFNDQVEMERVCRGRV